MHRRDFTLLVLIICFLQPVKAREFISCRQLDSSLYKMEQRLKKINTSDPDYIPLHYFFIQDIEKELKALSIDKIDELTTCPDSEKQALRKRFENLQSGVHEKQGILKELSQKVDSLYYEKAKLQYLYENLDNTFYFLDRSLQYNQLYTDALLMKCQLFFDMGSYPASISILQVLFKDAPLKREHEERISDFNMLFYKTLYEKADSLVKREKAAEALELFKILEQFCYNLPSDYCNDDYYHGILRSKRGIYESYLLIAKVAGDRENYDIERRFLEYAEEYRLANEADFMVEVNTDPPLQAGQETPSLLLLLPRKEMEWITRDTLLPIGLSLEAAFLPLPLPDPEETPREESMPEEMITNVITDSIENISPVAIDKPEDIVVEKKQEVAKTEKQDLANEVKYSEKKEKELNSQKEIEYNRLLVEGLTYCRNEKYNAAYEVLKQALELEKCQCFPVDFRVEMLFKALSKGK